MLNWDVSEPSIRCYVQTRNVSALGIRESLSSNTEFSKTTAHSNKDDSSTRENDKRGADETIMELYFVGCSLDVYQKVAGKSSEGVIPTPYYFSPQGRPVFVILFVYVFC